MVSVFEFEALSMICWRGMNECIWKSLKYAPSIITNSTDHRQGQYWDLGRLKIGTWLHIQIDGGKTNPKETNEIMICIILQLQICKVK
jgi:hypothetical protein